MKAKLFGHFFLERRLWEQVEAEEGGVGRVVAGRQGELLHQGKGCGLDAGQVPPPGGHL